MQSLLLNNSYINNLKNQGSGDLIKNLAFDFFYNLRYEPKLFSAIYYAFPIVSRPLKRLHKSYQAWFSDNFDMLLAWRNGYKVNSRQVWHSVFDWSLGIMLDSPEKVRELERKGQTWISVKEWEAERQKKIKRTEEAHEAKIADGLKRIQRDISNGRSFVKEKAEYNKRISREYGINMDRMRA